VADPRIAFCCKGDPALEQPFKDYHWRQSMKLTGGTAGRQDDEARLTQHLQIPSIEVPSQAAQSSITQMTQLQGECIRCSGCACLS
jgi:hypothetical protein